MQAIRKIQILLIVLMMTHFSYAGFSCKDVVNSLSSWKKPRDTLPFIDIPRTNQEQELKRRGHREQFYAGVDEVHYLIQLGNYLRDNSIDPQRTHIENFVPLINRHFRHLREGWQYYGPIGDGNPSRIHLRGSKIKADLNYRILRNRFASYIGSLIFFGLTYRIRKIDQPLSLEVWQNLNLWWAILMAPFKLRLYDTETDSYYKNEIRNQSNFPDDFVLIQLFTQLNKLFTKESKREIEETLKEGVFNQYSFSYPIVFPERVVLPTISQLGVSAMNRVAGGDQVIPVELANRLQSQDRTKMDPLRLFEHDLYHITESNYGQPLFGDPLFHHRLMSYFEQLSPQTREQAETIYFILIHELPNLTKDSPSREEITDKPSLLNILLSSFIAKPPIQTMTNESIEQVDFQWDKNKNFFENQHILLEKLAEYKKQEEQKYMDSLPPKIRSLFKQKDIVEETIDNPQLLEESAKVFIQAVQHVLKNHPDMMRN